MIIKQKNKFALFNINSFYSQTNKIQHMFECTKKFIHLRRRRGWHWLFDDCPLRSWWRASSLINRQGSLLNWGWGLSTGLAMFLMVEISAVWIFPPFLRVRALMVVVHSLAARGRFRGYRGSCRFSSSWISTGPVNNSITIEGHCEKGEQKLNQGLHKLVLTVSWDLRT